MSEPAMEATTGAAATSPPSGIPGELKRSTKVDFAVARERSFVRQGAQHQAFLHHPAPPPLLPPPPPPPPPPLSSLRPVIVLGAPWPVAPGPAVRAFPPAASAAAAAVGPRNGPLPGVPTLWMAAAAAGASFVVPSTLPPSTTRSPSRPTNPGWRSSASATLTRESKRKSTAMPSNRGKPTMEIYRPPNVRTDIVTNGVSPPVSARLNVHAKEFTMKSSEINTSRSSIHIPSTLNNINNNNNHTSCKDGIRHSHYLQTSKSSGNILHSIQHSKSSGNMMHSLSQSVSSGNVLQGPRVHFQLDGTKHNEISETSPVQKNSPSQEFNNKSPVKSCSVAEIKSILSDVNRMHGAEINDISNMPGQKSFRPQATALPLGLKRSKSLGAADMIAAKGSSGFGITKEGPDLGSFPRDIELLIQRSMEDPNKVPPRMLMELVRHIMDRVVVSVSFALPGAKLCISIIEKERKETFLESLLNTCQQWYQERERVLRPTNPNGSNQRYCAFMQFLNEMYCELKRRQLQLKTQYEGVPPGLVLLTLLYKCCQDCLKPPNFQGETDSLFFVLTSVGRDMEQELPGKLQQLLASIRDAFLSSGPSSAVKKTLLQLIELHASKWQLPASAVMYYTTSQ